MTEPWEVRKAKRIAALQDPSPKKAVGRPPTLRTCTTCGVEQRGSQFILDKHKLVCDTCRRLRHEQTQYAEAIAYVGPKLEAAAAYTAAVAAISHYFATGAPRVTKCTCCQGHEIAGEDPIDGKPWCTGCGWSVIHIGRCVFHGAGPTYYPHLAAHVLPPIPRSVVDYFGGPTALVGYALEEG